MKIAVLLSPCYPVIFRAFATSVPDTTYRENAPRLENMCVARAARVGTGVRRNSFPKDRRSLCVLKRHKSSGDSARNRAMRDRLTSRG